MPVIPFAKKIGTTTGLVNNIQYWASMTKSAAYRNKLTYQTILDYTASLLNKLEDDRSEENWIIVESDSLSAIRYDRPTKTLWVKFQNSSVEYPYYRVPEDIWTAFLSDRSKGRFFIRNIKGKFSEA